MKLINKIIPLVLLPFVCVSCGSDKKRLRPEDLDDYRFTKWVRDDGCFVFYAEGMYQPDHGFGRFSNSDGRCLVDIDYRWLKTCMIVHNGDTYFYYELTKVIENGEWNNIVLATDEHTKEEFLFKPELIELEEIDLNNFRDTNLLNVEKTVSFKYSASSAYQQRNVWLWNSGDEQYSLSFGENRTFTIVGYDKSSTGTYIPDYESVKLTFDDDNIFEQSELVLNYAKWWEY